MADEWTFPKGELMNGKRGLVMGVANDKSIAWGIAQQLAAQGAELAFTYQGEALEKRVRPLVESIGAKIMLECDVTNDAQLDAVFARARQGLGRTRLPGPLHRLLRQERAQGLVRREHHARELPAHDGHLRVLVRRRRQARGQADEAGRLDGHAHLSGRRARAAELQCDGRRQGVARSVHALHGARPRAVGIRVNAICAGADAHAGHGRHPGRRGLDPPGANGR